MTLVHRSLSTARFQPKQEDDLMSESCPSFSILPLGRTSSSSSQSPLIVAVPDRSISSNSISSSISSSSQTNSPNRNYNNKKNERKVSFRRQRQKLFLILCFMAFVHRQYIFENVVAPVGGTIIYFVTLFIIHQTPKTLDNALWKASVLPEQTVKLYQAEQSIAIDLVVSYCDIPIDWIFASFLRETGKGRDRTGRSVKLRSVTVISKCRQPVIGAPPNSTILELPNVGRCDHSYAYYMANYNATSTTNPNEVAMVLFLKDNDNKRRAVYSRPRTLHEMIPITMKYGFACHEERIWTHHNMCQVSSYYNWTTLRNMETNGYKRLERDRNDLDHFTSTNGLNLGAYADRMKISPPSNNDIVPVCYGGVFMTLAQQIPPKRQLFHRIEKSLQRASNVAEGHFAERLWASILSYPLNQTQQTKLLQMENHCHTGPKSNGVLSK